MALGVASLILVLQDVLEPIDVAGHDDAPRGRRRPGRAVAGPGRLRSRSSGWGRPGGSGSNDEERTDLVTGGWFSLCRNPIYTAMIVAWIGFALMVPTWLAFAARRAGRVGLELQVRVVEEPYLLRAHGDAYRAYARVGRFLPGLGRLREPAS